MDPTEFALIYMVVFVFAVCMGLYSLCLLFLIILRIKDNEIDNKESNEGIQFDFIYCIIGFIISLCFLMT